MGIKTEQNMEQAIIETAERLFLEKGFTATSTTQIAKAVGCNQALVHYYFRTKENLFNTIFEHKFKTFFQHLFEINNLEDMSFLEKVRHIVESHFDLLKENPKMPLLILNELSRQPGQIKTLRDKLFILSKDLFAQLNNDLQKEIEAGRIRQVEFIDIVVTMVTINVALFTMMPIASQIIDMDGEQQKEFIAHRREENVQVVLNYLKP